MNTDSCVTRWMTWWVCCECVQWLSLLILYTCCHVLSAVCGRLYVDRPSGCLCYCLPGVCCVFVYALLGIMAEFNCVLSSLSLLLCGCFSFISLSLEVSDGRIKGSIKDKKLFGIICIHVCLWLLISTTSAHTWSWVLLCARLFSEFLCACLELHEPKVHHYRTQEGKVRPGPGDDDLYVCGLVTQRYIRNTTHNPSVPTFLLHSDIQEQRQMYTLLSFCRTARSGERKKNKYEKYLSREGYCSCRYELFSTIDANEMRLWLLTTVQLFVLF